MEDEKCAYPNAHFQEEFGALKDSVACLTSLVEQALRHVSSEGPSTIPVTTFQT